MVSAESSGITRQENWYSIGSVQHSTGSYCAGEDDGKPHGMWLPLKHEVISMQWMERLRAFAKTV